MFNIRLTAVLLLACLTAANPPVPTLAPPEKLDLCYFYFAGLDDLGWTFSYNTGRLATHKALQEKYPNTTITSRYKENVYFNPNKKQNFLDHVWLGCRVFLTNSENLLGGDDWAAVTYPNISFILLSDIDSTNMTAARAYPNRIYMSLLFNAGFYAAGVAAALETNTGKIGFVSAWVNFKHSSDSANGFALGVASVNSSIKIDLITMESWFSPGPETEIANLLLDRGCDVLARITDAQFVDQAVRKRNQDEDRSKEKNNLIYSIGPHTKLQEYVGDTVLISIHQQWENIMFPSIVEVIELGNVQQQDSALVYGYENSTSFISALSPTAKTPQATFRKLAIESLSDSILCDPELTLFDGTPVVTAEANTSTGCRSNTMPLRAYVDVGQTNHGIFKSGSTCPAGTSFVFSWEPILTLACPACPSDSYSDQSGSAECTPCPDGTTTNGAVNATQCVAVKQGIDAVVVSLGAAGGVAVLVAAIIAAVMSRSFLRNRNAVTATPLVMMFTDIESSTTLWSKHPTAMADAITIHHRLIRTAIATHKAYEVKTIGDSFMIATKTPIEAAMVALDIQTALAIYTEWPAEMVASAAADAAANHTASVNTAGVPVGGIKVRIGFHLCTDCTVHWEKLQQHYDYYGNDINISARIESKAVGGQILLSNSTMDALQKDPLFELAVQAEAAIKLEQENVVLRGVNHDTFSLYSLTPFDLLPTTEGDDQVDANTAHIGTEAAAFVTSVDHDTASAVHSHYSGASSGVSMGSRAGGGAPPSVVVVKKVVMALLSASRSAAADNSSGKKAEQAQLLKSLLAYQGIDTNLGYGRSIGQLSLAVQQRLGRQGGGARHRQPLVGPAKTLNDAGSTAGPPSHRESPAAGNLTLVQTIHSVQSDSGGEGGECY